MQPIIVYIMVLLALLPFGAGHACAGDDARALPTHKHRNETTLRFGNDDRRIAITQWWQPIWQTPERIVYGDARTMGDNHDNFEGNLGLGYRQIYGDAVYGGYGFLDHRVTDLGSHFWQGTFGAEYIKRNWEARANIYLPVNRRETYILPDELGPYIAGNGIFVNDDSTVTEESQPGFDAEVGFRLPDFSRFVETARAYGGVYYFEGEQTDNVMGARARAKFQMTPWLDVGVRAQHDEPRGGQILAEITLKFPRPRHFKSDPDDLWSRLADAPERDVDIVTSSTAQMGKPLPITVAATGEAAHIVYVNNQNTDTGTGTFEDPYNNLAAAMAGARPYDTIYVAAGDGTGRGYDTGAHISADNLTLHGEGAMLRYDAARYTSPNGANYNNWILRGSGLHPLIGNTTGAGVEISANDVILRGIQVDGSHGAGVVVDSGANNILLEDTRITGNTGPGLVVNQTGLTDMNVRVRSSVISGNEQAGVYVDHNGLGDLNLDLGTINDYGFNDIYGNLSQEIYANTNGHFINAEGNFWGGANVTDTAGPNAGLITSNTYVTEAFCPDCMPGFTALNNDTNVNAGGRITSNNIIASGFRGHRYVMATGTANPELVLNNAATGGTTAQITAGDHIALRLDASTMGLNINAASLQAGAATYTYQATTEFLPNVMTNLIGWWDGHDVNADFHTDTSTGLFGMWTDKSGNGLNALASGSVRTSVPQMGPNGVMVNSNDSAMNIPNNFLLSSLYNSMTMAMVVTPGQSSTTPLFTYGTCTSGTPCVTLLQNIDHTYTLNITPHSGGTQSFTSAHTPTPNGPQVILLAIAPDGSIDVRQNGTSVLQTTYTTGSGFGNMGGMGLVHPIGGIYHEAALFNGTLGQTDQALVEQYLLHKWGIAD